MRYSSIRSMDMTNGEGIGVSLFVQGCSRHCKGCFNSSTWDFQGGKLWTPEVEEKFIELCKNPHRDFVSFLGGEPFEQGEEIIRLIKRVKEETQKTVYVWTGCKYNDLLDSIYAQAFPYINYLIDGEYQEDKKDFRLHLRGSANQHIYHLN